MNIKSILTACFIFCASTPLYAQNVVVPDQMSEYLIRSVCTDSEPAISEEKCPEWVAVATCALAYEEQQANVAKLFSDEQMQEFRIKGEKLLAPTCEPIARLKLGIDILEKDEKLKPPILSAKERQARWLDIAKQCTPDKKGALIAPEQYGVVITPMIDSSDFEKIKNDKTIQAFVKAVLEGYVRLIPDVTKMSKINEQQVTVIRKIEKTMPDQMTDEASLILLIDEIQHEQYQSALARMRVLDFSKLTQSQKDQVVPFIENSAARLWGNYKFEAGRCFKETTKQASSAHVLNYMTEHVKHPAASIILRAQTGLWQDTCDLDKLATQIFMVWNAQFTDNAMVKFMNDFIPYLEMTGDSALIRAFVSKSQMLSPSAQSTFASRYGSRLVKLALPIANDDYENGKIDNAISLLKPLLSFVPEKDQCELNLLYGRCLESQKNGGSSARQHWAQCIKSSQTESCKSAAYKLSIQSFRKAKMNAEAKEMEEQMRKGR